MIEMAHLLLDNDYDATVLNSYFKSLPMSTSDNQLILKLLDLGANINAKDTLFSETLLSNTLDREDIDFAQCLIQRGVRLEDVTWNNVSLKYKEQMLVFKESLNEKSLLETNLNHEHKSDIKKLKL